MTGPVIALFCMITFIFLLIGGIIGWIWKEHVVYSAPNLGFVHPEMFDANGNVIPDEILAVRFENDYDYDEEDDDNN
jgi:hypothetical protein